MLDTCEYSAKARSSFVRFHEPDQPLVNMHPPKKSKAGNTVGPHWKASTTNQERNESKEEPGKIKARTRICLFDFVGGPSRCLMGLQVMLHSNAL
jgi:hypothetical protein